MSDLDDLPAGVAVSDSDEEKAEITPRVQKEWENIIFADPKLKARLQSEEGSDTFTFGISDAVDNETKENEEIAQDLKMISSM